MATGLFLVTRRFWFRLSLTISILACGTEALDTFAQCDLSEVSTHYSQNPSMFGIYGDEVCVSGDIAVVGAPRETHMGLGHAGSAYVYLRVNGEWTFSQQLNAPDASAGDWFGRSVAISGETIIVGAIHGSSPAHSDTGAAYVFVRAGISWVIQQKLTSAISDTGDNFGWSVALAGDIAVIGAPFDSNAAGTKAGAAYIFIRSGSVWNQQSRRVRGPYPRTILRMVVDGSA